MKKKLILIGTFLIFCMGLLFTNVPSLSYADASNGGKGTIKISVTNKEGKPISLTSFEVYDSKKALVADVMTFIDGTAVTEELPLGKYTVKQSSANMLYTINKEEFSVTISKAGEEATLNVVNDYAQGKIAISKTETGNLKNQVAGAEYTIFSDKECKNALETLITDKNGIAESKKSYNCGTPYYIKETKAPLTHWLDTTVYTCTLMQAGKTQTVTVNDAAFKSKLRITKYDKETNKTLAGVTFQITSDTDAYFKAVEITTNKDGVAETGELPAGTYTVKETKAPFKYSVAQPLKVEIGNKENKTKTAEAHVTNVKVYNTAKQATVTLIKQVGDSAKNLAYAPMKAGQPIKGVKFNLLYAPFEKEPTTQEELKATTDDMKAKADKLKWEEIGSYTTDAKGTITVKGLALGLYKFVEVVPNEFKGAKDIVFTATQDKQQINLKATNDYKTSIFEMYKTDNKGNPIKGVVFDILDSNQKLIKTCTTDAQGKFNIELPLGHYFYKEVSVPNVEGGKYVFSDKPVAFDITKEGTVIKAKVVNELVEVPTTSIFEMYKTDNKGNPIEGVVFDILDSNKALIKTCTTDKNGKFNIELPIGNYFYKEVSVPNVENGKYIFSDTPVAFKITKVGTVIKAEVENEFVETPKTGIFEMYKTDNKGNPIEGVVFDILDNNKDLIKRCTTDKNGKFDIELPLGNYFYKEISVPNVEDGKYIFSDTPVSFKITKQGTVIKAEVVNELVENPKTSIFEMYKTDNKGNPIEGVVFDILDNNKELIKTCTTDKNGKFDIELPLGDYYYKEVSVPNVENGKYIFSDTPVAFKIAEGGTVIKAEVVNELVEVEVETPKEDEPKEDEPKEEITEVEVKVETPKEDEPEEEIEITEVEVKVETPKEESTAPKTSAMVSSTAGMIVGSISFVSLLAYSVMKGKRSN